MLLPHAEARVFQAVAGMLMHAHAESAREALNRKGPTSVRLRSHHRSLFAGNTEESTRTKFGDWVLACGILYPGIPPQIDDVAWPPARDEWLRFLAEARERTASYKRFQGVVGDLCELTKRHWFHKLAEDALDPRVLYRADHHRMMHVIKREHGLGVKQIAPIATHEARDETHFGAVHSVRGVAACAAFSIGALLGGHRPRTLTAILLEDLHLYVGSVKIDGEEVVVPCTKEEV